MHKKTTALLLALMASLSLTACGTPEQAETTAAGAAEEQTTAALEEDGQLAGDLNNDGQIEMGQDGVEVEVNVSDVHMDAEEASASGNWEALFTPVEIEDGPSIWRTLI